MDKHKLLIGLVSLAVVVSAANLVVSLKAAPTAAPALEDATTVVGVDQQPQEASLPETREFSARGLTFSYPNGWHIYATADFEDASRTVPSHRVYLDLDPIQVVFPSGGPMPSTSVTFVRLDKDEDGMASYKNDGQPENVTVNGAPTRRLLVAHKDDGYFGTYYEEVLVVGGYKIVHVYNDPTEENAPAWALIKKTLKIEQQ